MLPAFIHLAIGYDARGMAVKNSELVFLKLVVSCFLDETVGVKLQLLQQQYQDVSRVNIALGQSIQSLPMLA